MVPLFFGVAIAKRRKKELSWVEALKDSFRPTSKWCPSDPITRAQYLEFKRNYSAESSSPANLQGIDNPVMDENSDVPTIQVDSSTTDLPQKF